MLQEKLKNATKEMHDKLEQLMFVEQIMSKTLTLAQYHQILITNYLTHSNHENEIHAHITAPLNLQQREKLPALVLDLKEAGIDQQYIDRTFPTTNKSIPNEAFAFGAMYVLEGATLGGNVIQKQLALNSNFNTNFNLHYYRCYGPQLMQNWKEFVQQLNSLSEQQHLDAIAGAIWMFEEMISTHNQ